MAIPQSSRAPSTLALCAALAAAPLAQAQWSTTYLGDLGGGSSTVHGLHAAGQVAGQVAGTSGTGGGNAHAFIWEKGRMTDLGTLGGDLSAGYAISANGQVTGSAAVAADAPLHAFRHDRGGMRDLGTLDRNHASGAAINSAGQVAGTGYVNVNPGPYPHAFRSAPGVGITDLGTLGGSDSSAYLINEAGTVAGQARLADEYFSHGFVSTAAGAGIVDVGTLGGGESRPYAINARGQLVGATHSAHGPTFFLYREGEIVDVFSLLSDFSGFALETAYLNDAGQIAGSARDDQLNGGRAFLLTPVAGVPEAPSFAMLASGMAVIALGAPRRRFF